MATHSKTRSAVQRLRRAARRLRARECSARVRRAPHRPPGPLHADSKGRLRLPGVSRHTRPSPEGQGGPVHRAQLRRAVHHSGCPLRSLPLP